MDRRNFIKTASGMALTAAVAMAGTSKVVAATEALGKSGKKRKELKMERRNLGGMSVSAVGLGCLPMVGTMADTRHHKPRPPRRHNCEHDRAPYARRA